VRSEIVLRVFLTHEFAALDATRPLVNGSRDRYLVQCFDGCGVLQPLDLILDHQFPAFQFGYLQVVR
jgi:hypothetical protein